MHHLVIISSQQFFRRVKSHVTWVMLQSALLALRIMNSLWSKQFKNFHPTMNPTNQMTQIKKILKKFFSLSYFLFKKICPCRRLPSVYSTELWTYCVPDIGQSRSDLKLGGKCFFKKKLDFFNLRCETSRFLSKCRIAINYIISKIFVYFLKKIDLCG